MGRAKEKWESVILSGISTFESEVNVKGQTTNMVAQQWVNVSLLRIKLLRCLSHYSNVYFSKLEHNLLKINFISINIHKMPARIDLVVSTEKSGGIDWFLICKLCRRTRGGELDVFSIP